MADKIFSVADGLRDELPSINTAKAGRFLVTTDTGEMYYEPEDKKRIQINPQADWQQNDENANDYVKNRPYTNISEIKITLDNMTDFSDETVYVASKDILVQYAVKPSEETESGSGIIIETNGLGTPDHNFNSAKVLIKKGSIIKFDKRDESGHKILIVHAFGSIVKSRYDLALRSPAEIYQNYIGRFINANDYIDTSDGSLIREYYVAYSQIALFDNAHYNLVNGESPYSLRTSGSKYETPAYKLGQYAFAEGNNTMASSDSQHVQGQYNIEDRTGQYAHIIGNGSSDTKRSNAHTVDWKGNAWYAGDVYIGSTSGTNKDEGSKKLATEEYAYNAVSEAINQNVHTTNISEIKITLDNMTDFSDETVYVASKDILVQYAVKPSEETEDTGIIEVSHFGIIIDHNFNSADVLIKKGSIIKFSKVSASGNKRLTIHAFGSIVKSRASVGLNPIAEIYQNYIGSFRNCTSPSYETPSGEIVPSEIYVDYEQVALFDNAHYNLVNGESPYSLRTSGSKYETPAYKLGQYAFAEGNNTMASSDSQHVQGQYNIEDRTGQYAHIIGNGTSDSKRSNAHTVDWEGNAWYAGDVYVGSTSGTNKDEGSKKLATENRTDNTFANALKGSKSGSVILIDDVSPVTHEMGVKVRSKNLIPYPYAETTKTQNGITFTDNGDGSITISGKAERDAYFRLCVADFGDKPISAISADSATNGIYTASKRLYYNNISKVTSINILSGATVDETVYPQLELGTIATDYTPYVPDLTSVKVSRCGKNLIPYPYTYETFESNGITFRDNKDGTITLNGRNNGIEISNYSLFTTSDKLSFLKPNTDYYLSCNLDNIIRSLRTVKSDGTYKYYTYGNINFPPDETPDRLFIQIKKTNTTTYNNTVVKLQIELGTAATDYEPYITPTEYTPTADGTVNGVTSLCPITTLMTDTEGVIIEAEYNRDTNKAFAELQQAIISLGGNV